MKENGIIIADPLAAADEKYWKVDTYDSRFKLSLINDGHFVKSPLLVVDRIGCEVIKITYEDAIIWEKKI